MRYDVQQKQWMCVCMGVRMSGRLGVQWKEGSMEYEREKNDARACSLLAQADDGVEHGLARAHQAAAEVGGLHRHSLCVDHCTSTTNKHKHKQQARQTNHQHKHTKGERKEKRGKVMRDVVWEKVHKRFWRIHSRNSGVLSNSLPETGKYGGKGRTAALHATVTR